MNQSLGQIVDTYPTLAIVLLVLGGARVLTDAAKLVSFVRVACAVASAMLRSCKEQRS